MKISTRGRYGLKAMLDLAVNSKDAGCVSLKSIAQRQGISESYLEQLMAQLKKAGLIKSIRGAQGGYILINEPLDITIGNVLRALEGPLTLVECETNSEQCGVSGCKNCVTKNVWEKLSDTVNEAADQITLADLVEDYNNL